MTTTTWKDRLDTWYRDWNERWAVMGYPPFIDASDLDLEQTFDGGIHGRMAPTKRQPVAIYASCDNSVWQRLTTPGVEFYNPASGDPEPDWVKNP